VTAETSASPGERAAGSIPERFARAIVRLPAWIVLGLSGLTMTGLFYFAFTQRYGLAENVGKPRQTMATLSNMSAESALLYVAAFIALFGLYALVLRRGLRPATRTQWILVAGFALVFNVALLPMYSVDAADIYDYIIRGRMSAIYGLNPMHDVPSQVSSDPFYRFAAWHDVSSAYGPAWESLASLTSRLAGDDPIANVIAFKLLALAGYALTALLIGLTLRRLAPRRTLTGVVLFAWNPLVVFMTGGRGHNDLVMTACILFSVYCLARRWYVAATLGALVGALVKFIPILLIPIIGLVALRELRSAMRIRYVVVSAVLGAILLVTIYGPYWTGLDTLRIESRGSLFTGSVATLVRQVLSPTYDGKLDEAANTPNTNALIQRVVLILFGVFYLSELDTLRRQREPIQPIRTAALILVFYLLVSCIWFQAWYVVWVVGLVALLDNTPLRRLVLIFSYFVTWESLLYNYVTLRPGGWMPIPWRDLIPVAAIMGPAWAYVGWFWVSTWLRRASRTPAGVAIGQRLRQAREDSRLTPSDLADELDLRTDDLIGYERGEKSMPLDTARALCQRLGLALTELIPAL
jgi:DNA-binding XRE family transcriptional regulator